VYCSRGIALRDETIIGPSVLSNQKDCRELTISTNAEHLVTSLPVVNTPPRNRAMHIKWQSSTRSVSVTTKVLADVLQTRCQIVGQGMRHNPLELLVSPAGLEPATP
jgi:hypothetical protein